MTIRRIGLTRRITTTVNLSTGVASLPATQLWHPDDLAFISGYGEGFREQALANPNSYRSRLKPFLFLSPLSALSYENPLAVLAGTLRLVAEEYFGEPAVWFSASCWLTLPTTAAPVWSQNWHRDPEASSVLKVFLHLNDVDETNGPLQYVLHSSKGRDVGLCLPRQYAKTEMPAARVSTLRVPKHTVVFADTGGIHRGGRVQQGYRLQAVWGFVPASQSDRVKPIQL